MEGEDEGGMLPLCGRRNDDHTAAPPHGHPRLREEEKREMGALLIRKRERERG